MKGFYNLVNNILLLVVIGTIILVALTVTGFVDPQTLLHYLRLR